MEFVAVHKSYSPIPKLVLICSILALSACGGGGGGSSTTTTPNTGTYLDSKVQGLGYSTSTLSGTTNANGEFQYNDGETVTFSLHGQTLAQVPGFSVLTPFDNLDGTAHEDNPINILRLMQTLDTDGDPSNGIVLPTATVTMNLNFDQNMAAFAADNDVVTFITDNTNVTTLTVTPVGAVNHFNTTLATVTDSYTLDLAGKTATSVVTASHCTNGTQGGFTYAFTSTGFTMTGSDQFNSTDPNFPPITCTLGASTTQTFNYVDLLSDFSLYCGPVCTYKELNRLSTGIDGDGRDFITSVWHVPNSKVVTEIKRITSGTLFGFIGGHRSKEVITFD
jgi:hypothetical protein